MAKRGIQDTEINPIACYGSVAFHKACQQSLPSPSDSPMPNVVCAPLAEFTLLSMLCAGTQLFSDAKGEMIRALCYLLLKSGPTYGPDVDTELSNARLEHRAQHMLRLVTENILEDGQVKLNVSLWANHVLSGYQMAAETFYKCEVHPLHDKRHINNHVSACTNGMITDLLVDEPVKFAFLTVMFFAGKWKVAFNPALTYQDYFYPYHNDDPQPCSFMCVQTEVRAATFEFSMAFVLPYEQNFVAVYVVPLVATEEGMENCMREVCTGFGEGLLDAVLKEDLETYRIEVPKMTLRYKDDLEHRCRDMGMRNIFDEFALTMALDDESLGIVTKLPLDVCLDVKESGTEMAVAVAATQTRSCAPLPPLVKVCAPFVMSIFHVNSKTPLMFAQIHDVTPRPQK